MQAERTPPGAPTVVDMQRSDWAKYRDACFIRSDITPVWLWSAAHDFCTVGLYHIEIPGAVLDVGTHAIALSVFAEHHMVPIVRLPPESLAHLQSVAANPLSKRQTQLRAEQLAAERVLREQVQRQVQIKVAPGSPSGAMQ
jgi:hypothetical protein